MGALCRGGRMDAFWGGWMDALSRVVVWMR